MKNMISFLNLRGIGLSYILIDYLAIFIYDIDRSLVVFYG